MKKFTTEEKQLIINLSNAGKTAEEIAKVVDRSKHSIHQFMYNVRTGKVTVKGVSMRLPLDRKLVSLGEHKEEPIVEKIRDMSPREMIKKLYDLGYRIENNQLVCYVKQTVQVRDIIGA